MQLPKHKLIVGPEQPSVGFLKTVSHKIDFEFENGETASMLVDSIKRKAMDVVVIIPYYKRKDSYCVYLRSCIRPSFITRDYKNTGRPDYHENNANNWELPAGLIEPEEIGEEGIINSALRELEEEIGFLAQPYLAKKLGHRYFTCLGNMAERMYTVMVNVGRLQQHKPTEDGSALEKFANITPGIELTEALSMIDYGKIVDSKTILSLYRLHLYLMTK